VHTPPNVVLIRSRVMSTERVYRYQPSPRLGLIPKHCYDNTIPTAFDTQYHRTAVRLPSTVYSDTIGDITTRDIVRGHTRRRPPFTGTILLLLLPPSSHCRYLPTFVVVYTYVPVRNTVLNKTPCAVCSAYRQTAGIRHDVHVNPPPLHPSPLSPNCYGLYFSPFVIIYLYLHRPHARVYTGRFREKSVEKLTSRCPLNIYFILSANSQCRAFGLQLVRHPLPMRISRDVTRDLYSERPSGWHNIIIHVGVVASDNRNGRLCQLRQLSPRYCRTAVVCRVRLFRQNY